MGEKQHSSEDGLATLPTLLPRPLERAEQKHPSKEITSGSHLVSLWLCVTGTHFIPCEMKGGTGQGAKKLGSLWCAFLKKPDSYLHLRSKSPIALNGREIPLSDMGFAGNFWQGAGEHSMLPVPLPLPATLAADLCSPLCAKLILYLLCYVNEILKHFSDPLRQKGCL